MKLQKYARSNMLPINASFALLALVVNLQASVIIEVVDRTPNGSPGTGTGSRTLTTNYGSILAPALVPTMTYTLSGLDLQSIGGNNSENIVFTVTFSQIGGTSVQFNSFGNISVTGGGDNNQVNSTESLKAEVALTSTSFVGGLSNLSIAFTKMQIGGYSSGDAVDIIHNAGTITRTYAGSTNMNVTLPASTSFFVLDTTAGAANIQDYSVKITATPEPSVAIMGALGAVCLLRRKR